MCIEIWDVHICGLRGREIDFRRCHFKSAAIALMRAVYDDYNRRDPITVEEDMMIRHNTQACEQYFQSYDEVSIVNSCQACSIEVENLGIELAIESCGRVQTAATGRRLEQ